MTASMRWRPCLAEGIHKGLKGWKDQLRRCYPPVPTQCRRFMTTMAMKVSKRYRSADHPVNASPQAAKGRFWGVLRRAHA